MSRSLASPSPRDRSRSTALVYVRVSKYDENAHQISPAAQLDRCKALPALAGLTVEAFQDLDLSGKSTKRPDFQRMLARMRHGDVALVACYSVSRLSRSVRDLYDTLQRFDDVGVGFVSATEPIETATPMGRAFLGILAVLAQLEREQTSQRVGDMLGHLRSQGRLLGSLPAGYLRSAERTVVVDETVAPTIRLIFERYASGAYSFRTLAIWLNSQGIRPVCSKGGNAKAPAVVWSNDVLKEILKRPTYAGLLPVPRDIGRQARLRGEDQSPMAGDLPAIVSREVWQRCQDIRTRHRPAKIAGVRARKLGSRFPLSWLLRCVECGASMRGTSHGDSGHAVRYYVCSDRHRYASCKAPLARADALEAELAGWLAKCHPDDRLEAAAQALVERGMRQRQTLPREWDERRTAKELEARRKRTALVFEMGLMSESEFRNSVTVIEAQLTQLKAQPEVPTIRQFSARLTDLMAAWTDADLSQRGRLMASILSEIQVRHRRIAGIRPRPGWAPYFEELLTTIGSRERETRLELATTYLEGRRSTN